MTRTQNKQMKKQISAHSPGRRRSGCRTKGKEPKIEGSRAFLFVSPPVQSIARPQAKQPPFVLVCIQFSTDLAVAPAPGHDPGGGSESSSSSYAVHLLAGMFNLKGSDSSFQGARMARLHGLHLLGATAAN